MPFDLPPSFLTGIDHVDEDHQKLVSRINRVAEVEEAGDKPRLLGALAHFMADLAEHFASEEAHLKDLKYPMLDSHSKHHAETIVAVEQLIHRIEKGELTEPSVAHICFHEPISAVLMTDLEFMNWLADRNLNPIRADRLSK